MLFIKGFQRVSGEFHRISFYSKWVLNDTIVTHCNLLACLAARSWKDSFAVTAKESGRRSLLSVATGTNTGSPRTGEAVLPWNIYHFRRYALVNLLLLFAQWPWQKVWCVHWGETHTNSMTFGETGKIGITRADRKQQASGIVSDALNKL